MKNSFNFQSLHSMTDSKNLSWEKGKKDIILGHVCFPQNHFSRYVFFFAGDRIRQITDVRDLLRFVSPEDVSVQTWYFDFKKMLLRWFAKQTSPCWFLVAWSSCKLWKQAHALEITIQDHSNGSQMSDGTHLEDTEGRSNLSNFPD